MERYTLLIRRERVAHAKIMGDYLRLEVCTSLRREAVQVAFKTLYAVYDKGKPLGEHTTKEWEDLLSIPRQAIRDYAREGRTYGKQYAFEMVGTITSEKPESEQKDLGITVRVLAEFKRSVKVGDKFVYEDSCKFAVVRKYRNIVELVSLKEPKRSVTMTYMELFKQRKKDSKRN